MKRRFRPYTEWEDAAAGMWRKTFGDERAVFKKAAADLMKRPTDFLSAMVLVIDNWPNSSEVNFSFRGYNRQAWIGHAACCIATNSPEDVTREAWHTLTPTQQDMANAAADQAIELWEGRNAEKAAG